MRLNRHRCGFSLVELVTSLAIISILMVAMGSAIVIATRGLPDPTSPFAVKVVAAQMAAQLANELTYAITVTEATPTAITFTVADRDSDLVDETIRYAWSGVAGDPLTREYNSGTAINVVEDVQTLAFTYSLRTETGDPPPPTVEGPEIVLSSFVGSASTSGEGIKDLQWPGQYFNPSLPEDAISWRVTRVMVKAEKAASAGGQALVQLRTADDDTPTTTVLEQQVMYETSLSAKRTWQEFSFSSVDSRPPGEGLCLVLAIGVNPTAGRVESASGGPGYIETADAGASWTYDSARSLSHFIYGHVTTPNLSPPPPTSILLRVGLSLEAGTLEAIPLYTATTLLNEPVAP